MTSDDVARNLVAEEGRGANFADAMGLGDHDSAAAVGYHFKLIYGIILICVYGRRSTNTYSRKGYSRPAAAASHWTVLF